jgi:hypothetical protein
MVAALGDIVVPTVLMLGEFLVAAVISDSEETSTNVKAAGDVADGALVDHTDKFVGDVLSYDETMLPGGEIGAGGGRIPLDEASSASTAGTMQAKAATDPSDRKKKVAFARAVLSAPSRGAEVVAAEECILALSDSFSRQLRKLVAYPSFDKLLLRILHVLGYFLGAPHGFDHRLIANEPTETTADSSTDEEAVDTLSETPPKSAPATRPTQTSSCIAELRGAVTSSERSLRQIILALKERDTFQTKHGLLQVTVDIVQQYQACPDIKDLLLS